MKVLDFCFEECRWNFYFRRMIHGLINYGNNILMIIFSSKIDSHIRSTRFILYYPNATCDKTGKIQYELLIIMKIFIRTGGVKVNFPFVTDVIMIFNFDYFIKKPTTFHGGAGAWSDRSDLLTIL